MPPDPASAKPAPAHAVSPITTGDWECLGRAHVVATLGAPRPDEAWAVGAWRALAARDDLVFLGAWENLGNSERATVTCLHVLSEGDRLALLREALETHAGPPRLVLCTPSTDPEAIAFDEAWLPSGRLRHVRPLLFASRFFGMRRLLRNGFLGDFAHGRITAFSPGIPDEDFERWLPRRIEPLLALACSFVPGPLPEFAGVAASGSPRHAALVLRFPGGSLFHLELGDDPARDSLAGESLALHCTAGVACTDPLDNWSQPSTLLLSRAAGAERFSANYPDPAAPDLRYLLCLRAALTEPPDPDSAALCRLAAQIASSLRASPRPLA